MGAHGAAVHRKVRADAAQQFGTGRPDEADDHSDAGDIPRKDSGDAFLPSRVLVLPGKDEHRDTPALFEQPTHQFGDPVLHDVEQVGRQRDGAVEPLGGGEHLPDKPKAARADRRPVGRGLVLLGPASHRRVFRWLSQRRRPQPRAPRSDHLGLGRRRSASCAHLPVRSSSVSTKDAALTGTSVESSSVMRPEPETRRACAQA